jgi:hypothetical protein
MKSLARSAAAIGWRTAERFFKPSFMRRLDHRLLTHRPLVWRTRLHWSIWYALLVSSWATLVCLLQPQPPASVWTTTQLGTAMTAIGGACVSVALFILLRQLRFPLGEQSLTRHAVLISLNTVTALFLLAPYHAAGLALTYRIANSVPDAVFHSDFDLHARHEFWGCSSSLDTKDIAEHRADIDAALERFGLRTDGELSNWGVGCAAGTTALTLWPATQSGPTSETAAHDLLVGRLTSVRASKLLWRERRGAYFDRYADASVEAVVAFLGAVLISLFSHPGYAWRRRFLRPGTRRWRLSMELWRPAWLERIDRRLLLDSPVLWATRFHILSYHSLTLGVVLAGAALLAVQLLFAGDFIDSLKNYSEAYVWSGFAACGAIWPALWALTRSHEASAVSPATWRPMIRSFFLASLPVPLLAGLAGVYFEAMSDELTENLAALLFIVLGALLVVSNCVVRTYRDRTDTTLAAIVGIVSFSAPLVVMIVLDLEEEASCCISAAVACSWMIAAAVTGRSQAASTIARARELGAAMLIAAAPTVLLYGVLAVYFAFEVLGGYAHVLAPIDMKDESRMMVASSLLVLAYPLYLYGLSPLLRVLVRAKYEPRSS